LSTPTTIALLSGGLDSATAAALAVEAGHRVIGLSFDYGQRHRRELAAADLLAQELGLVEHQTIAVNLAAWGGSSLTDAAMALPSDGVEAGVIPSTYVPGRNTVFIALGLSLAEARGAQRLVLGVNAVDYSGYPDCRPDYLEAFQTLADLASKAGREGRGAQLWAPLVEWQKTRIVAEALRLGVPIAQTWSCYSGGSEPCGLCDSCRIRDAALIEAGHPSRPPPGPPGPPHRSMRRLELPWRDPWTLAWGLAATFGREGLVWLDGDGADLGRWSVLGVAPQELVVCRDQDPFGSLAQMAAGGGHWMGWLAYEAGAWVEPAGPWHQTDMAVLWAARHDPLVVLDQQEQRLWLEGSDTALFHELAACIAALPGPAGSPGAGPQGSHRSSLRADPLRRLALAHQHRALCRAGGPGAGVDRQG
jgi:7-cyano-7-deazaguanine synthase